MHQDLFLIWRSVTDVLLCRKDKNLFLIISLSNARGRPLRDKLRSRMTVPQAVGADAGECSGKPGSNAGGLLLDLKMRDECADLQGSLCSLGWTPGLLQDCQSKFCIRPWFSKMSQGPQEILSAPRLGQALVQANLISINE